MPCEECEEGGKYKWGETGECLYETLKDCQLANDEIDPSYAKPVDFTMHFNKEQMRKLHEEGEVLIEVEGSEEGDTMNILFTYDAEREEEYNPEEEEIKDSFGKYFDDVIENIKK